MIWMLSPRKRKIQEKKHHNTWKWTCAIIKKRPNEQITLACAHQKMNDEQPSQKRMMAKIERDLLSKEKPNKKK